MSQTVNGLDTSMTYTITYMYSIAGAPNGASSQTCYVYVFKDSQTNTNLLVENIVSMGAIFVRLYAHHSEFVYFYLLFVS